MSRNFKDFLTAYESYGQDGFCPPQFLRWSGLSILAGALERRIWLPWGETYAFYPNIYVLLVSNPGTGKSVSLDKAFDLLSDANAKTSMLNIMPNQVTESKFIELMGQGRSFVYHTRTEAGALKENIVLQNSGYFYGSEGSATLKNVYGEFIDCLTAFYDCPRKFSRATKKDGVITLKNVCMNIMVACTFDYLGKLVNDANIQGGFASRIIYVQNREKIIKEQEFQNGISPDEQKLRDKYRLALIEDLAQITKLVGKVTATPEVAAAWKAWWPKFEKYRQDLPSLKLQSILARTNTSVLKIAMLLSVAESNDLVIKMPHFEKAVELVEGINATIPGIFEEAKASQAPGTAGSSLTSAIISTVRGRPNISQTMLESKLVALGHSKTKVTETIKALIDGHTLGSNGAKAGIGVGLVVVGDTNQHL
jgi:hypothetical protein